MGGSEEDVWHRVMLVAAVGGSWRQMAAVGGRSDPAAFLLSESRKVALLLQKNGSSTVCDRNQQKNIKNRKTELKKTGIAPIVLWHQNGRG